MLDFIGHGASVLAIKSLAFWGTHILSQFKEVICFVFVFLKRTGPLCRSTQTCSLSHPYLFLALSRMIGQFPVC